MRSGDWKLVTQRTQTRPELFNLAADPGEAKDLAAAEPARVAALARLYETWLDGMAEPMHGGGKRYAPSPSAAGKAGKDQRREQKQKARDERRAKEKSER